MLRQRWRPGVVLSVVAVVVGVWFTVLNAAAAIGSLPYALHGERVTVTIRECGPGRCRGDYRAGTELRFDQLVTGAETARVGSMLRATVDRRHPGEATTADAGFVAVEAALFAVAGLGVAGAGSRAAVRAWRRRGVGDGPTLSPAVAASADVSPADPSPADDDPLAGIRRRRFGAR